MHSYQFVGVFGPGQVAHLRAGVDALERLSRERVPEADAAVGCSAPGRQQAVLVRRPRDGLHCRQVIRVLLNRRHAGVIPHQQLSYRNTQRGKRSETHVAFI